VVFTKYWLNYKSAYICCETNGISKTTSKGLLILTLVIMMMMIKYDCGSLAELFTGDTKNALIKYSSKTFG
jgi:hypothetical protein